MLVNRQLQQEENRRRCSRRNNLGHKGKLRDTRSQVVSECKKDQYEERKFSHTLHKLQNFLGTSFKNFEIQILFMFVDSISTFSYFEKNALIFHVGSLSTFT